MKNKLFLIAIALCAGLQSNVSFAGEPQQQSWADWFRAKYTQLTKTQDVRPALRTIALAGSVATYGSSFLPQYEMITTGEVTKYWTTLNLSPYISTFLFLALAETLGRITNQVRIGETTKDKAIENIKISLSAALSQTQLYPTRSSKIHALLKKDEFLQYITDEYGLVQEACNKLIKEISAIQYPEKQKMADTAIDAKITDVRKLILQYKTLDDQIKALENQTHELDIPGMQACLSVYFRLKNKQAVENKLSPEEQAIRQSEREHLASWQNLSTD